MVEHREGKLYCVDAVLSTWVLSAAVQMKEFVTEGCGRQRWRQLLVK